VKGGEKEMTNEEIKKFAEQKLEEITLEIGDFVNTARIVEKMNKILKRGISKQYQ